MLYLSRVVFILKAYARIGMYSQILDTVSLYSVLKPRRLSWRLSTEYNNVKIRKTNYYSFLWMTQIYYDTLNTYE